MSSFSELMMRHAIVIARQRPSHPFASVIVDSLGDVVAEGINRSHENLTWHAEIDAINECSRSQPGEDWSKLTLYTTAEPCPMCMSAILWTGIGAVLFGTSIATLQQFGWKQIDLSAHDVISKSWNPDFPIQGGVLETECNQLFVDAPQKTSEDSVS